MPIAKTEFSLKDEDVERIKRAIGNLGETGERVINDYLHNIAGEKLTKSMDKYIPVAKIDKTHPRIPIRAKGNKWSEQDNYNLAVKISNSSKGTRGKSFYYLYYVITGTGTSENKGTRDFMEKGFNEEYNDVVDGLVNELKENIEKEMKV
jgi:hypothetical protein